MQAIGCYATTTGRGEGIGDYMGTQPSRRVRWVRLVGGAWQWKVGMQDQENRRGMRWFWRRVANIDYDAPLELRKLYAGLRDSVVRAREQVRNPTSAIIHSLCAANLSRAERVRSNRGYLFDTPHYDAAASRQGVPISAAGDVRAWKKLNQKIRTEIDETYITALHEAAIPSFRTPENGEVPIKTVDCHGIESMEVVTPGD